ncbi:hypothetical protein HMI56_005499 [Coelomomyces lativittatus]|nr:hypothetical protein HMI56_005499 [Coelomomyces lativittatus]
MNLKGIVQMENYLLKYIQPEAISKVLLTIEDSTDTLVKLKKKVKVQKNFKATYKSLSKIERKNRRALRGIQSSLGYISSGDFYIREVVELPQKERSRRAALWKRLEEYYINLNQINQNTAFIMTWLKSFHAIHTYDELASLKYQC